MKHIDVTSQQTRHQMLMDLATAVTLHRDRNPDENDRQEYDVYPITVSHTHHSSK